MTESSQHTSKPQVEVEASGGDDNKSARRGAIFIGVVLVGYIVYLVVTGQMGQFWAAMSSVQAPGSSLHASACFYTSFLVSWRTRLPFGSTPIRPSVSATSFRSRRVASSLVI